MRPLLALAFLGGIVGCARGEPPKPFGALLGRPRIAVPAKSRWNAGDRARVVRTLQRAFAGEAWRNAGIVILAADGSPLFERRGRVPMTPASTMKLVVAATALATFGTKHRFETSFSALAPPRDGVLNGPLWLVGGGDPLFASSDLRAGVGTLARAGVREVRGDLIVDASMFPGREQNAHWDPSDLDYDYAAGTSAISLDWDVAAFVVTPGFPGAPARVRLDPPNADVGFEGTILTSPPGYGSDVHIDRLPVGSLGALPTRNAFAIGGHIQSGIEQKFFQPIAGVPYYVGDTTAAMLQERGIALDGAVRVGVAPLAARRLWLHRSAHVDALLREMLVNSDNHTAEQLLRLVGFQKGFGGTDAGGLQAERAFFAQHAIDASGWRAFDGSGLAPSDRIAPLALAQILLVATAGSEGASFLRALPLAGLEGTVRYHRLDAALGRVRAKSGHIDGVNALAGLVSTRRHGRLAFAFVVNGPQANAGDITQRTDAALDALAEF
ncbi:MAG: D-alanyl-D-alanine carboxypeptidase/D-alanyl-D-alanine-endopeptidase [Candidatus Baltobacteraceae bacterium]